MVFERIREIICDQLDLEEDKVTMDSDIMEDFEADSLDVVDLVMSIRTNSAWKCRTTRSRTSARSVTLSAISKKIPEHLPDDDPPCAQQGDFLCACGANGKEEESKQ